MRLYLEDLLDLASSRIALSSAAAAVAATLAVTGLVYLWPGEDEIPAADAVTVSGPIFKPVALTPSASAPAVGTATSRPRDSFAVPPGDDSALTRSIQHELARAACYDGAVNGNWNAATRRGMAEFTQKANARLPVNRPAPELLSLLEQNADIACGANCADASCTSREARETRTEEVATVDPAPAPQEVRAEPRETWVEPPSANEPAPSEVASVESREAADVDPAPAPSVRKSAYAEPRRAHRRYKKKSSFSRQVNKSFKSLSRALSKLF